MHCEWFFVCFLLGVHEEPSSLLYVLVHFKVLDELRGHCPWVWKLKKTTPGNLADEAEAEQSYLKRGNQMAQKVKKRLSSLGSSLQHVLVLLVVREREETEALCIMILLRVNTKIGILVRNLIYGYPARVGATVALQAGIVHLMLCTHNMDWYCQGMQHVFSGISMWNWNAMYFLWISLPRTKLNLIWRARRSFLLDMYAGKCTKIFLI